MVPGMSSKVKRIVISLRQYLAARPTSDHFRWVPAFEMFDIDINLYQSLSQLC